MIDPTENIPETPWQVERLNELTNSQKPVYFDVEDFIEIIEYYAFQANYQLALNLSEYACKLHPTAIALMLKRAQLLASLEKETPALELLSNVEILEPSNHEIFLTRAAIYSQQRKYEKAIEEYSKAVYQADDPDYVYCNIAFEYENLGNYDKTIEYLKKALDLNPDNDLAMYEAAYCFDLLSLSQESIDFFTKLIDKHPYSSEAWFNLGISYINAELYEKALEAFEYTLAIEPEHGAAIFHTAYTQSLMGNHDEAITVYHSLLDKEDDDSDAMVHYYIGECYEKKEDYQNARLYYHKATNLNPDITDAWIGLGVCENELGRPKIAIKRISKGLESEPDNAAYLSILADIYFQENDIENASLCYEKAIDSNPDEETVRQDFSDALGEKLLYKRSCEVVMKAIEDIGPTAGFYYRMAALLYLRGRNKEGAFFLEEALSMDHEKHVLMFDLYPKLLEIQQITNLINIYCR